MKDHCSIHITDKFNHKDHDCKGRLITRRSIYGAIATNCETAWTMEHKSDANKGFYIDLDLWPEILFIE